jgi:adenylate cyclase
MNPSRTPRFGLRLKLALFASVLAVAPVLGVGVAVVEINRAELKDQSLLLQAAIAEGVDGSLQGSLKATRAAAFSIAAALADPSLAEPQRLATALALVAGSDEVADAAVYSAAGERIDVVRSARSSGQAFPNPWPSGDALGDLAERSGASFTSSLGLTVVAPIGAPPRGFVVVALSTASAAERLTALSQTAGDALEEVLVLGEGRQIIASSRPEGAADPERTLALLDDVDTDVTNKAIRRHGPFIGRDGRAMFGSLIARPAAGWTVVAQTPQTVAYRSLDDVRRTVVLAALVAIAAALAAGLAFSRLLTRPLTALMAMVRALGARRYTERAHVDAGDELGILGDALNAAADELASSEERLKEEAAIRQDLGRYIDQSVVDRVVRREQSMALGGERRHIAVLFADVVAFTPLTERLPPETVVTVLNELFTFLTELVFRHDGTLDKFIGDGLMAIFGAPVTQDDVEARALACAEEMMAWLEVGNTKWEKAHDVRIQLAIGVHAGPAVVGNIGSATRMEYTAIGETVNIAARLESSARPGQILTTQAVVSACPEIPAHPLGPQHFAGMAQPIETYALDPLD